MESNHLELGEKAEKKEVKSIGKYGKIRVDYFLQKVFNNLEKKRKLEIVKNNKNIKKRINISINDYKEYSEKYSSIEVEIKPVYNKSGKFINIKEKEQEQSKLINSDNILRNLKSDYFIQNFLIIFRKDEY